MKAVVVNRRTSEFDVYIGRGSKWGNDWSHEAGTQAKHVVATREEAVEAYRVDLWRKIRAGEIRMHELVELHGKRLGCFCAPLACHGDVLADAAEWAFNHNAMSWSKTDEWIAKAEASTNAGLEARICDLQSLAQELVREDPTQNMDDVEDELAIMEAELEARANEPQDDDVDRVADETDADREAANQALVDAFSPAGRWVDEEPAHLDDRFEDDMICGCQECRAKREVPTWDQRDDAYFDSLMAAAPSVDPERQAVAASLVAEKAAIEQANESRAEVKRLRDKLEAKPESLMWNPKTGGWHIWRPDATSYRPDPEITAIDPTPRVFSGVAWEGIEPYQFDAEKTYSTRELVMELVFEIVGRPVKAMETPAGELPHSEHVEANEPVARMLDEADDEVVAYLHRDPTDEEIDRRWLVPDDFADFRELVVDLKAQAWNHEAMVEFSRQRLAVALRKYLGTDELAKAEIVEEWAKSEGSGRWYPSRKLPVVEYIAQRIEEKGDTLAGYASACASVQFKAARRNPRTEIHPSKRLLTREQVANIILDVKAMHQEAL